MPQSFQQQYILGQSQGGRGVVGASETELSSLESKFKMEFGFKEAEGGMASGAAGANAPAGSFATSDDPYGTGSTSGGTWGGASRDDYLDF